MTIEPHAIMSSCGEYSRDVWFSPGPDDRPRRLAVFLDGEHYIHDLKSVEVIEPLLASGAIPPLACVFVSHVSAAARHEDYACNNRYARFIAEDVVRWAMRRSPQVAGSANLICGLSLSGLQAALTAFHYPAVFSYALCQSGSFWWFADHEVRLPSTSAKFWLSVGSEETATNVSHPPAGLFQRVSQIDGVERAAKEFESLGATVRYNLHPGGHAAEPWREELAPALKWLVGS
jgi:enterochelin esterase-like enzyme